MVTLIPAAASNSMCAPDSGNDPRDYSCKLQKLHVGLIGPKFGGSFLTYRSQPGTCGLSSGHRVSSASLCNSVRVMPLYFKIPAYVGNSLLLVVGIILVFQQKVGIGVAIAALGCLNLYLVRKLDVFSHEEVWLASELVKERLREELQKARSRFGSKP
jgi:hypothetical protein